MEITTALESIGGDLSRYRRLLELFIDSHGQSIVRLIALLTENDVEQARRITHTLKSTAALIGAKRLAAPVQQLNERLRKEGQASEYLALAEQCELEFNRLREAISELIDKVPRQLINEGAIEAESVAQAVDELSELLTANNARSVGFAHRSMAALKLKLGGRFPNFMQAIDNYEFEQALQMLQDLPPQ